MLDLVQQLSAISDPLFWVIVFIISAVLEGCTAALVTIWFMGGALVAVILSLFNVPFIVQFIVFLIVSVTLLILTRPFAKKWLKVGVFKTNLDQVIGKQAKVTKVIDNSQSTGEVYVEGKYWTARNVDDKSDPIEVGEFVIIKSIEGVKLFVENKNN